MANEFAFPFLVKTIDGQISVFGTKDSQPMLTIPFEHVDQFCESIYWARKSILQSHNDALVAAEGKNAQ